MVKPTDNTYIISPPPGERLRVGEPCSGMVGRGLGGSVLLSTTYFGPVQWYSKLRQCMGTVVDIEAQESFVKQTYRNRCMIATANGVQALTIPVQHGSQLISEVEISDQGNWRHLHWQALKSAYGESAFFDYYEDDLRGFYFDEGAGSAYHEKRLLEYNMLGARLMCRLLDLDVELRLTESYRAPSCDQSQDTKGVVDDYRYAIRPKSPPVDEQFVVKPYYQVYRERHGFLGNLSILDLLFNEGPEAILFL